MNEEAAANALARLNEQLEAHFGKADWQTRIVKMHQYGLAGKEEITRAIASGNVRDIEYETDKGLLKAMEAHDREATECYERYREDQREHRRQVLKRGKAEGKAA